MKKMFLYLFFSLFFLACGQSGTVIEVEESSPNKFVVVDEKSGSDSYILVHYLNGNTRVLNLSEIDKLINTAPPLTQQQMIYSGGNSGGVDLHELVLYNAMFNGFGGSSYREKVIHHQPNIVNIVPSDTYKRKYTPRKKKVESTTYGSSKSVRPKRERSISKSTSKAKKPRSTKIAYKSKTKPSTRKSKK